VTSIGGVAVADELTTWVRNLKREFPKLGRVGGPYEELKRLGEVVEEGEMPSFVDWVAHADGLALLVVTSRKVTLLSGKRKSETFRFEEISDVKSSTGGILGDNLMLEVGDHQVNLRHVSHHHAAQISTYIRSQMADAPSEAHSSGGDTLERLQKLEDLRKAGVVSDIEFEAIKARIIAG
jgi:hypothetical protein